MSFATADNLALVLTPPGSGAIAVIRLVGPGVEEFLRRHFSRTLRPGLAVHGELRDARGSVIDDPVIVLHAQRPCVDVNVHGGTWVVESLLELAQSGGFKIVRASSPPLHPAAVDADSTIEAEMLAWLPLASTELGLRTLLAQPAAWNQLARRREITAAEIDQILADRALEWLLNPPRVAIVGAPNVGKSTLANRLFAQERSITADLPGTTRDWVGELANIDGLPIMLVDTPGHRQTDDPIEAAAIARSGRMIESADAVVLVLDVGSPFEPGQRALLGQYPDALVVLNKSDQPAAWDLSHIAGIATVATSGAGVDELCGAIRRQFHWDNLQVERPRCWTVRQRTLLQAARISGQLLET